MDRSEALAAAAAAHAARVRESGADATAAEERAAAASGAPRAVRRHDESEAAAQRTEGRLSDWTRLGTRRGVTPDEQERSAWTVVGWPEVGDTDDPGDAGRRLRVLSNVLLSTATHAGRAADAARRNPNRIGAARAAARRTARRYTDHGADMTSLGDVLGSAQRSSDTETLTDG